MGLGVSREILDAFVGREEFVSSLSVVEIKQVGLYMEKERQIPRQAQGHGAENHSCMLGMVSQWFRNMRTMHTCRVGCWLVVQGDSNPFYMLSRMGHDVVSQGCCNQVPNSVAETAKIYSLTVLEAESLKSKCQQGYMCSCSSVLSQPLYFNQNIDKFIWLIFYLKTEQLMEIGRGAKGGEHTHTHTEKGRYFYLLACFSNGCSSQGLARPKPRAGNSTHVSLHHKYCGNLLLPSQVISWEEMPFQVIRREPAKT